MADSTYFTDSELSTLRAKYRNLRDMLSAERLTEASTPRADIAAAPTYGYHSDGVPIVGASFDKRAKKRPFLARIRVTVAQNGRDKTVSLGYYETAEKAGLAYRVAHMALWGEMSYAGCEDSPVKTLYRRIAGK